MSPKKVYKEQFKFTCFTEKKYVVSVEDFFLLREHFDFVENQNSMNYYVITSKDFDLIMYGCLLEQDSNVEFEILELPEDKFYIKFKSTDDKAEVKRLKMYYKNNRLKVTVDNQLSFSIKKHEFKKNLKFRLLHQLRRVISKNSDLHVHWSGLWKIFSN